MQQVVHSSDTGGVRRVLVAVDDSPRATSVFDVGAEYAMLLGAQLYLVRSLVLPPEFPPAAVCSDDDPLPQKLTEVTMQQFAALAQRAPHVEVAARIVTFGDPVRSILETAENYQVDLIVLGSHGYRGWDHVLGTTAAAIANRSNRNVLVVHSATPMGNRHAKELDSEH